MSESPSHRRLVSALIQWIADTYLDDDLGGLLVDSSSSHGTERPLPVYGYIPDVYILRNTSPKLIIGEAKTSWDIENSHTTDQFRAFLRYAESIGDSVFVLAVPWTESRLASNIIKRVYIEQQFEKVSFKILQRLTS